MTLSQLGAEVIRVDPIGGASDIHRWPLAASGTSIYWTGLNKGKRSATIDLRSPEGQELVQRLIVEGDGVVVTNAAGLSWLSFDKLAATARRRDPCPAARPPRRLHRRGLHGQRGNRISVGHRSGEPCRPDQPRAAGLGCVLRPVRRARDRRRGASPRPVRSRRPDQHRAGRCRAGHRRQPGIADRASGERHRTPTPGQRDLRPVRSGFHQPRRRRVHGCHVDQAALSATSSRYPAPAQPVSALAESLGADFSDEGERYRYRDVLSGLFATWFADHTAEEITEALSATSVLFERYRTFAQVAEDERVTDESAVLPVAPGRPRRLPRAGAADRLRRQPSRQRSRRPDSAATPPTCSPRAWD